jgi:hypothetical protein
MAKHTVSASALISAPAHIPDFTYWQGKMWQEIRMEKYI